MEEQKLAELQKSIDRLEQEEARLQYLVSTQAEEIEVCIAKYEELAKVGYRIEGERNALAEMVDKLLDMLQNNKYGKEEDHEEEV